jgi:cyclophilin family peptidyl-prolyl cis-trans isomerase
MPIPHLNGQHTVFGRVVEGLVVARSLEVDDEIRGMKVTRKRVHDYIPETISTTPATPFPTPTTQPTP